MEEPKRPASQYWQGPLRKRFCHREEHKAQKSSVIKPGLESGSTDPQALASLPPWAGPWGKADTLDRDGPWGLTLPGSSVGSGQGSKVLDPCAPGLA